MATQVTTKGDRIGFGESKAIRTTVLGGTVSQLGTDTNDGPHRRRMVYRATIGAQEVDLLVRLTWAHETLYLDIVLDDSVADLTTRVAALAISGVGGHPSKAKDKPDGQAMTAAGGS